MSALAIFRQLGRCVPAEISDYFRFADNSGASAMAARIGPNGSRLRHRASLKYLTAKQATFAVTGLRE